MKKCKSVKCRLESVEMQADDLLARYETVEQQISLVHLRPRSKMLAWARRNLGVR